MYADFAYYTGAYQGTRLTEDAFHAARREAEAYVDRLTYGRLHRGAAADDAVKSAVCAVAETIDRYAKAADARPIGVTAANTDGYSESYRTDADLLADAEAAKLATAELYLPRDHPLRYAGVL